MLIIFDSNYVGYVSAFALSQGLTYRGGRTEVIFGFLNKILTICNLFEPEQIAFCWDSIKSKRKEIFPEYKSRKDSRTEEEIASFAIVHKQFDEIRNVVLPNLGFSNIFMQEGYEGDDLIARLVVGQNKNGNEQPIVVANDEDLFQLLDYCRIFNAVKKTTVNKRDFEYNYQIEPSRWAEVKSIAGCKSDKVPSLRKGLGSKTAIKYLKGQLSGETKAFIDNSEEDRKRNRILVTLPFPGTRRTLLKQNSLSVQKLQYIIEEYGFSSMDNHKTINSWERTIKILNQVLSQGGEK